MKPIVSWLSQAHQTVVKLLPPGVRYGWRTALLPIAGLAWLIWFLV
jgi:hypothetical protein